MQAKQRRQSTVWHECKQPRGRRRMQRRRRRSRRRVAAAAEAGATCCALFVAVCDLPLTAFRLLLQLEMNLTTAADFTAIYTHTHTHALTHIHLEMKMFVNLEQGS